VACEANRVRPTAGATLRAARTEIPAQESIASPFDSGQPQQYPYTTFGPPPSQAAVVIANLLRFETHQEGDVPAEG